MAEITDNEFQGTPFNFKEMGGASFADDEFDFLKKKKEPPKTAPETVSPETAVPETAAPAASAPAEPPPAEIKEEIKIQPVPPETLPETPLATPAAIPAVTPAATAAATPAAAEPLVLSVQEFRLGQIIQGKIIKVEKSGLVVDFGYKSEGYIEANQIHLKANQSCENSFKEGEVVSAQILGLDLKDGFVLLSKKSADVEVAWSNVQESFKIGKILEAQVISAVRGGVVVDYSGLRGFLPASHILKENAADLEKMVGQRIFIKVIEINRPQNKIVFSHRLAAAEAKAKSAEKIWQELEMGEVRKGVVSGLKSFGAFVNLGGVEGLIHISELSWGRVKHPSEVVKVGDEIEVFILSVDRQKKKVGLGLKQLQPDPWVKVKELYRPGQVVKGKIVRIVSFGAFVELERGLEGLIHLSELADPAPARPEDVVKIDDEVKVKILRIIPEQQKIGLSLKAVQEQMNKEKLKETLNSEERKVTIGDIMKEKNVVIEPSQTQNQPAAEAAPTSPSAATQN